MRKRIIIIISLVVLLAIVVGLTLYFVPKSTKINVTLNATKLDADGNEIGTVQIVMQGNKFDYLFQADRIELSIAPFDDFGWIRASEDSSGKSGTVFDLTGDYLALYYSAWDNSAEDTAFCNLIFTEDFDCLVFCSYSGGEEVYYVGSVSGDQTADEIVQYFRGLVPGYK